MALRFALKPDALRQTEKGRHAKTSANGAGHAFRVVTWTRYTLGASNVFLRYICVRLRRDWMCNRFDITVDELGGDSPIISNTFCPRSYPLAIYSRYCYFVRIVCIRIVVIVGGHRGFVAAFGTDLHDPVGPFSISAGPRLGLDDNRYANACFSVSRFWVSVGRVSVSSSNSRRRASMSQAPVSAIRLSPRRRRRSSLVSRWSMTRQGTSAIPSRLAAS